MNYGSNNRSEENFYVNFVYKNENGLGFDLSSTFCELNLVHILVGLLGLLSLTNKGYI